MRKGARTYVPRSSSSSLLWRLFDFSHNKLRLGLFEYTKKETEIRPPSVRRSYRFLFRRPPVRPTVARIRRGGERSGRRRRGHREREKGRAPSSRSPPSVVFFLFRPWATHRRGGRGERRGQRGKGTAAQRADWQAGAEWTRWAAAAHFSPPGGVRPTPVAVWPARRRSRRRRNARSISSKAEKKKKRGINSTCGGRTFGGDFRAHRARSGS